MPLVLGTNSFIPGFEDGLVGSKAGDEITLDLEFPADYRATAVAGKPVQFKVKVSEVAEAELPEIDAEFMSSFEVSGDGMDSFLAEIRNSMESELEQVLKDMTKTRVLNMIYDANSIEVPEAVVQSSINEMIEQMRNNLSAQGRQVGELDRGMFEPAARRKATMGILLNEIARQQGFRAAPEQVKSLVENLAESYDQPEQVVRWYYSDRSRLANIEALVIEEMIVDWVLENAKVTENAMTFDEVMQTRQT
jgi:trigger factor